MIWRGSLFAKYAIPLVLLVMGGLVISGLVEIYFSYKENKSALARIQHEKAAAAAIRIEQFVRELAPLVPDMELKAAGTDGGFVLMPGCDIPPTVPYENIQKFIQVAHDWKY